jgi:hypothetical protein
MSGEQLTFVITSFVILALVTLAVQFRWLRPGRVRTVLVFLAGIGIVASLWAAGLPPKWFSGTKSGFGIAASLAVGALLARASNHDERRGFGVPLLSGMSLTLLLANVLTFAGRVL